MQDKHPEQSRIPISLGIYPSIQNRLIALVTLACALPSLILGTYSVYLSYQLSTLVEQADASRPILQDLYQTSILTGVIYVLSVILIFLLTLLYSHRLVGPLDRLRNELESMVEKRDVHLLRIRQNDYLRPFFETVNKVLINLAWEENSEEE